MNKDILNLLPEKKDYNEPLDKLNWSSLGVRNTAYILHNEAITASVKALSSREATEEEIVNKIKGLRPLQGSLNDIVYKLWLKLFTRIAQALKKEYFILRKEK